MSNGNVTEFPSQSQATPSITLDTVVQAMDYWRANKKHPQEQIPDSIWQQIFSLLGKFPESTLRSVLGLTNTQFRRKLAETSSPTSNKPSTELPRIDFCEVKEILSPPTPLYKPAKIPATNTLVVEFCRADGRLMKIHTTTDSFAELMKAFFEGI
jgi:hypothetical protein